MYCKSLGNLATTLNAIRNQPDILVAELILLKGFDSVIVACPYVNYKEVPDFPSDWACLVPTDVPTYPQKKDPSSNTVKCHKAVMST